MQTINSILRNYFPMAQEDTLHEIAGEIYAALTGVAPVVQQQLCAENQSNTAKRHYAPSARIL